jgi:hypothetical protein
MGKLKRGEARGRERVEEGREWNGIDGRCERRPTLVEVHREGRLWCRDGNGRG